MSLDVSISNALKAATASLASHGNPLASLDAEYLLAHVLGCGRMALFSKTSTLSSSEQQQYDTYIKRRLTDEPVAYITGTQAFWTLEFKVNEHTLIPRPDTETLVDVASNRASVPSGLQTILDLGTGSGCVMLSLLSEWPNARGIGVDMSMEALAVAQKNADTFNFENRVDFIESNWFESVEGPVNGFNVIVSNPPYIPASDIAGLMADVRDYEPLTALEGGTDGLDAYRTIAGQSLPYLAVDGLLAVEVGIGQAQDVADIFVQEGLVNIKIDKDLCGIDRVVSAKKYKI